MTGKCDFLWLVKWNEEASSVQQQEASASKSRQRG
jgi:hypothetical protein